MTGAKSLNTVLGIIAILVLVLSFTAFAYSLVPKGDADILAVNGFEYAWESVFSDFQTEDFTANDEALSGVPVEQILLETGLDNPEAHGYRFVGLDGYQKDVTWEDVQNGYLVEDGHKIVFPHMTRSFWVRDLVSIEVV